MINNYERILDLLIQEVIPPTYENVKKGNKIFGGAVINIKDLSTICIGLNNEIINPLFHGEISTIINFFTKRSDVKINDCVFITTHEPCSLCLSAITWAGFKKFYYFFPYDDTKNKFNIPHDLNILSEVFNINNGEYVKKNYYWESISILSEINLLDGKLKNQLSPKIKEIKENYSKLSEIYQNYKKDNNIPLN